MTTLDGDRATVLERLPFLARLEPALRELVSRLFQLRTFGFGDTIVAEGEVPDGMYVLAAGSARVLVVHDGREMTLARLAPGDWFGETAILDKTTRTATVRASEPVSALWLDRVVFDALLELHPEIRGAFGDQARVEMLHRFLRTHAAFEDLSLEAASAMYPELRPVEVTAGTVLVTEGEPGGTMYLVEDGRLEATTGTGDSQLSIGFMRTGDILGERSLVTGEPCVATVRAVSDARLLALDRDAFRRLSEQYPAFARRVNEQAAGRNYLEEARVPLDFAKEILPGGITEDPASRLAELEMPPGTGQGKRRSRRKRKFAVIEQVDEADCGVACLAMVAGWHGVDVPMPWLREVAGTDQSGTTLRRARRHRPADRPGRRARQGVAGPPRRPQSAGDPPLGLGALGRTRRGRRPPCPGRRPGPGPAADGPRGARPPLGRLCGPHHADGHDPRSADRRTASQMAGAVRVQASPGADRSARPCSRGGGV